MPTDTLFPNSNLESRHLEASVEHDGRDGDGDADGLGVVQVDGQLHAVRFRCLVFDQIAADLGPMFLFLKYFRRKIEQKYWRFLLKLRLVFAKIVIITLVFEKKRQFFRRKLAKIAENCEQSFFV
jgi:hypothetical protein